MKIPLLATCLLVITIRSAYPVQIRPIVDANTKTRNAVVTYGAKMNFFVLDGPHDGDVLLRVFAGTREELVRRAGSFGPNCAEMESSVFHGWWMGNSRLTFGGRFQEWPFSASDPESSWVFIFEVIPGAKTNSRYAGYLGDQVVELNQNEAEAYFGSGLQVRMLNPNASSVRYSSSRTNAVSPPTLKATVCAIAKILPETISIGVADRPRPLTMTAEERKRREGLSSSRR